MEIQGSQAGTTAGTWHPIESSSGFAPEQTGGALTLDEEIDLAARAMELTVIEDKFVVTHQEKSYHVSKAFFETLESIRGQSAAFTFEKLRLDHNLNDSEVQDIKTSVHLKLGEIVEPRIKSRYIKFPVSIFPASIVAPMCAPLTFLFNRKVCIPLAIAAFLANISFVSMFGFGNASAKLLDFSAFDAAVVYSLILFVLLFHEFGHATATAFHKLQPKEIGIGFYIAFPVLYANVSETWKLGRHARISVNLGGVYFQLLANTVLFAALLLSPIEAREILLTVARLNLLVAISVLIPFIRNDGYWVVSDYFDIQNLNNKAYQAPYWWMKTAIQRVHVPDFSNLLLAYSLCNYLFLAFTVWLFMRSLPGTISESISLVAKNGPLDFLQNHFGLALAAAFSAIGVVVMIRPIFAGMRRLFMKKKGEN